MSWKPIESAPKEAVNVLLWNQEYREVHSCFYTSEGWRGVDDHELWGNDADYSHWMLPPAPPQEVRDAE